MANMLEKIDIHMRLYQEFNEKRKRKEEKEKEKNYSLNNNNNEIKITNCRPAGQFLGSMQKK